MEQKRRVSGRRMRRMAMGVLLVVALTVSSITLFKTPTWAAGNTYYVSINNGDDSNAGTKDAPFKTIQHAADLMQPGDVCMIREGVYPEEVKLKNSGEAGARLTFTNYPGETVTVSGCDPITGWTADKNGIYKAPMGWSLSLQHDGDQNQLFADGELMYEARYPNVQPGDTLTNFHYGRTGSGTGFVNASNRAEGSKLVYPDLKEVATTADFLDGATIWMVPGSEWTALTSKVTSYDPETGTVYFPSTVRGIGKNYYSPAANKPFYIFGAYGLLDAENEWWYDKENKEIYVKVKDGKNPEEAGIYVEAKARESAFDLSGCSYVDIVGINTRGSSIITDENSSHILMKDMKCEYVGHCSTIELNDLNDNASPQDDLGVLLKGSFIEVNGCEISNSSGPVINIQGSDNRLINSYIHDGNYIGTYTGHSKISGRRQFVSNNTMCESGRDVVSFRNLSESVIQYNDIYGAGRLTLDVGIMYSAETDGQNTLIHHNFIHDNYAGSNTMGLYPDEMTHNFIMYNNVIFNTKSNAIQLNTPSLYNLVYNNTAYNKNTLADTYQQSFKDNRGTQEWNNMVSRKSNTWNTYEAFATNNVNEADHFTKVHDGYPDTFVSADQWDFRLTEGSQGIGAGIPISGVTKEGVLNPSVGAYEAGDELFKVGHDFENPPEIIAPPSLSEFEYRNRIKNGGFEYGTLEGWNGTAEVRLDTAWHSNNKTAATCFYGAVMQSGNSLTQTIDVEPLTTYTLGLNTRAPGGDSAITFGVIGLGSGDVVETRALAKGTNWVNSISSIPALNRTTNQFLTFTTGPSDTKAVVTITNSGSNEIYLDDVGVQKDVKMIGDLSKEITPVQNDDGTVTLTFDELETGHQYFVSDSTERESAVKAGSVTVKKPASYASKLTSGMSLSRNKMEYINVAEVVNGSVVGIWSYCVIEEPKGIVKSPVNDGMVRDGSFADQVLNVSGQENADDNTQYHINLNYSTSSGYSRNGYMQFDLSDIDPALVKSAKLEFYVYKTNPDEKANEGEGFDRTINVKAVDFEDWDEDTLTWNFALGNDGKMKPGDIVGTVSGIRKTVEPRGKQCSVDITDYILQKAGKGAKATVQLSPAAGYATGNMFIATKENPVYGEEYGPRLVLEYYGTPADLEQLKTDLAEYEKLAEEGADDYTTETWDAFIAALDAAKAFLDNPRATQDVVNEAMKALKAAKEDLVSKPTETETETSTEETEPSETETSTEETQPTETDPVESETSTEETQPTETEPVETESSTEETQPTETEPVETETSTEETQPTETETEEPSHVETDPVETETTEPTHEETDPVETDVTETDPAETESSTEETDPAETESSTEETEEPDESDAEVKTDKLEEAIGKAEMLKAEDYTADSFAKVEEALDAARKAMDAKTQKEVDDAEKALNDAIEDLVPVSAESSMESSPEESESTPSTGDATNFKWLAAVMVIALAAVAGAAVTMQIAGRKRRKNNR